MCVALQLTAGSVPIQGMWSLSADQWFCCCSCCCYWPENVFWYLWHHSDFTQSYPRKGILRMYHQWICTIFLRFHTKCFHKSEKQIRPHVLTFQLVRDDRWTCTPPTWILYWGGSQPRGARWRGDQDQWMMFKVDKDICWVKSTFYPCSWTRSAMLHSPVPLADNCGHVPEF